MKFVFIVVASCSVQLAHAQSSAPSLNQVTVSAQKPDQLAADMPGAIGQTTGISTEQLPPSAQTIDALLIDAGVATWDAANSLGIASGLNIRGFTAVNQGSSQMQASRNFLNGHADLVWRFARDPATVARIELVTGSDATLLGAGSPAGALLLTSKTPVGVKGKKIGVSLGTTGATRLVGDVEWHGLGLQTRAVVALQRNDKGIEGVRDERSAVLLSTRLAAGKGSVRLDLEYDQNTTPFTFGTAYVGGRFLYDQPLVDARAFANRQYSRQALYVDYPLGSVATATAYWQHGSSTRSERLLGFYDVLNATTLRGYYRTIDETNGQDDAGVKVKGSFDIGTARHSWAAVAQQLSLSRDFAGPQNIGGFSLDASNPVFPVNLGALTLSPRYIFERYSERGIAVADTVRWGSWEARLGARRSRYALEASASLTAPLAKATDTAHNSVSIGLARQITDTQRVWASRSTSFLPNRGRLSGGAFLPPSISRQHELGWTYEAAVNSKNNLTLTAFDLLQSNLPAKDPKDPDAFVLLGSIRSRGVEVKTSFTTGPVLWQGSATRFQARVQTPISTTQGLYLAGSGDGYGALRVSGLVSDGLQASLQVQAAAKRPGDDKGSFYAPGYAVINAALESTPSAGHARWGVSLQNALDARYVRALTGPDNVWQGQRRALRLWTDVAF